MKKLLIAGLMALGLLTAAPAHADEQSYLRALDAEGIHSNDGSVSTMLNWGYMVCTDARIGRTVHESVENVYWYDQNNLNYSGAQSLVASALIYLC